MAAYRITLSAVHNNIPGYIRFSCSIEKETSPSIWEPLDNSPTSIDLSRFAISKIINSDKSASTQRTEILEILRHNTALLEIIANDRINDALTDLLPSGWPVTINL